MLAEIHCQAIHLATWSYSKFTLLFMRIIYAFFSRTVCIFFHSTQTQVVKEVYHPRLQNSHPPDLVRPPAEAGLSGSKVQCFVD